MGKKLCQKNISLEKQSVTLTLTLEEVNYILSCMSVAEMESQHQPDHDESIWTKVEALGFTVDKYEGY